MVTVKLKDGGDMYHNGQEGTVSFTLKQLHEIYIYNKACDEFLEWTKREYYIKGQGRTTAYNKSVNGASNSSHLKCLARDTYYKGVTFDKDRVIKWGKKWKSICEKYGMVGEFGYYPYYTYEGCKGMIHIGGFITYSKSFYNWMTDGSGQHNMYFDI